MNNHHFSYPVVVPLGTMTISGHSTTSAPPLGSPQAPRPLQTSARHGSALLPSPFPAGRASAWR
jgi:hypothetical protein